jgi:hypothetical protein
MVNQTKPKMFLANLPFIILIQLPRRPFMASVRTRSPFMANFWIADNPKAGSISYHKRVSLLIREST